MSFNLGAKNLSISRLCLMSGSMRNGHLFLHCPLALNLWFKIFGDAGMDWVIMNFCVSLSIEFHRELVKGRKLMSFGGTINCL